MTAKLIFLNLQDTIYDDIENYYSSYKKHHNDLVKLIDHFLIIIGIKLNNRHDYH